MNDALWFSFVSGTYDVQLGEPRPQFGQERRKKNSHFANSAYFSNCPVPFPPRAFKLASRRCTMGWCFEPPLQPLPRPCIHACAHLRAIIGTAVVCFTSDAQLTPAQLWHHCSQARYAAGADGLEEEILRSSSHNFGTVSHKSV